MLAGLAVILFMVGFLLFIASHGTTSVAALGILAIIMGLVLAVLSNTSSQEVDKLKVATQSYTGVLRSIREN